MAAVGEIGGVRARREYVIGLFTEYLEGALGPELRFAVEDALDRDPILDAYFESYQRAIVIARETFGSRLVPQSQLTKLLNFLRDNTRES